MKITTDQAAKAIEQIQKLDDQIKMEWVVGHGVGRTIYALTDEGELLTKRQAGPWKFDLEGSEITTLLESPTSQWTWDNAMETPDMADLPEEEKSKFVLFEDGTIDWSECVTNFSWDQLCEWAGEEKSPIEEMIEQVQGMCAWDRIPLSGHNLVVAEEILAFIQGDEDTIASRRDPAITFRDGNLYFGNAACGFDENETILVERLEADSMGDGWDDAKPEHVIDWLETYCLSESEYLVPDPEDEAEEEAEGAQKP